MNYSPEKLEEHKKRGIVGIVLFAFPSVPGLSLSYKGYHNVSVK